MFQDKKENNHPQDTPDTLLYYSKFRSQAPKLRTFIAEIERRLLESVKDNDSGSSVSRFSNPQTDRGSSVSRFSNPPQPDRLSLDKIADQDDSRLQSYVNLLHDVHQSYIEQRDILLCPSVHVSVIDC